MKYPVLSHSNLTEIADKRIQDIEVEVDPYVEWVGSGEQIDLAPIQSVAASIVSGTDDWAKGSKDVDKYEGQKSQALYDALSPLPIPILDDRGFWRYLSARLFWDFIVWRHPTSFKPDGTYLKYVDGAVNTESVLVRMFLRAAALGGQDTSSLAGGIDEAGDFWRSHIIRVQTGFAPPLARSFAMKQKAGRLTTVPIRAAAKRLNRTWSNVILHMYDEEEASDIVDEIWSVG